MLNDFMKKVLSFAHLNIFLAAFLLSYATEAQTGSDSLLLSATLPNIIQYALNKQPVVQQATIDEEIARLQIKSKLSEWFPQVSMNYLYQHNFQVQTSVVGGNPVKLGVDNTSSLQFQGSQTVFNRDVLLVKRSKTDILDLAGQQTGSTKIDIIANVSKAFYDVLATMQQRKVSAENITRLQRSLNDARARFDAGIADKTDYKRATIALNNALVTQKAIDEALEAKRTYLKSLMNYPQNSALEILYDSASLEKDIQLDTLRYVDFTQRIEFSILQTQRRLNEANVRYNKWSYIPTLDINGAYNLNFLNNEFNKLYSTSYPNSFAGLTLVMPIFQGGKRKYNTEIAKWQLKQTELQMTGFINSAVSEYSNALATYKGNLAYYLSLKENVELAIEVYDVINLQYQSGIKTYLEVINAETDLRTARFNYFDALYKVLTSKIDVQVSAGDIKY
jgi:outer membrane protein